MGITDEDARRPGVDPPALLKGLVAPSIFMKLGVGLGARHDAQWDKGEGPALPAPAAAPMLLLALGAVNSLPHVATAIVEEQGIQMPRSREVLLIAFPVHGSSLFRSQ